MKCILKIVDGPAAGKSIVIKPGETITVGRSDRSSFMIPDDVELSGQHFSVTCSGESCVIEDLKSTNKTSVNGDSIARKALHTGDTVQAGKSTFRVAVENEMDRGGQTVPELGATARGTPSPEPEKSEPVVGFVSTAAAEILTRFSLTDAPYQSVDEKCSTKDLVDRLRKDDQATDALRLLAYALPKRSAVWWACLCVRQTNGENLKPDDDTALKAAEAWVRQPSEENRRAAMAVADKLGHGTAACWAAVGAFWSGGSMAPPNAPVVPPADDLTGKAIFGAVQLAAVAREPEKAPEKQSKYIEIALGVAGRENPWSEDSTSAERPGRTHR